MKSKHTKVSLEEYNNLLKNNSLPLKFTISLTSTEVNNIDVLLKDKTYKEVAKHFNIKSSSILQRSLKKVGYVNKYHRVRAKFNADYFENIDTAEKAYIVGFIAADGCITNNTLSIELSKKDLSILEFIKNQINYSKELETNIIKNGKEYCRIRLCSSKIVSDLKNLGIFERKTFNIGFIKLSNRDLQKHLIHGWFDGDGCITLKQTGKGYIGAVSIVGSVNSIADMANYIKQTLSFDVLKISKRSNTKVVTLYFQKREYIKRFYDFIYDKTTFGLDRKKQKFLKVINIPSETSEVTRESVMVKSELCRNV